MNLKEAPPVRVTLAVVQRFGEDRSGYFAATITYYAFLSLSLIHI